MDIKALVCFIKILIENHILKDSNYFLAFPAIGCGKLNFDSSMIAKYMLRATRDILVNNKVKMNISFVLLPEQNDIYDKFIQYIHEMDVVDLKVSLKIPTKKSNDDQATIAYDKKSK